MLWVFFLLPPARRSQISCVPSGIEIPDLIATHPEVLGVRECNPDPVAKLSLYSAYSSGVGDVCQMWKYVFLWRLPSPSHLLQLFCNLQDLWSEFSACLERVALSDLASRTYAWIVNYYISPHDEFLYQFSAKSADLHFQVCPGLSGRSS